MKDIKIFFSLLKNYFPKIYKYLLFIVPLILLANFLILLQPLLFASIINIALPKDMTFFNSVQDIKTISSNSSIFNLNTIGNKIIIWLENFYIFENLNKINYIYLLAIFYLLLLFLSSILNFICNSINNWCSVTLVLFIREKIIDHLIKSDFAFFKKHDTGELISRVIQDTKQVSINFLPIISTLLQNGVLVITYSIFLIKTDFNITVISIGIISLQFFLIKFFRKPIQKSITNYQDKSANLLSFISEFINSIKLIKIFNIKEYKINNLKKIQLKERKAAFISKIMEDINEPVTIIFSGITSVLILILVINRIDNGDLTIQGGVMFLLIGRLTITPFLRLSNIYSSLLILSASYSKINKYQNIPSIIKDGKENIYKFKNNIKFNNVVFDYGNKNFFFNFFEIKKKQKIAIVGPSGSGKSTFIDLLTRIYDPLKGKILIDGKNIKNYKLKDYRSLFGVIPQEPFFYNDTIRNNIICGRYGPETEKKLIRSVKLANAEQFILKKKSNYSYVVGNKGENLSGGERQRIAIARALFDDPEIIIFDEATNSLDLKSEKLIQESIKKILKYKTVIIIAHSFSAISLAEKILVLSNGKIENFGIHNHLLRRSSIYKQFFGVKRI